MIYTGGVTVGGPPGLREEAVLVALPGTMCSPAVFDPLARALAGELVVDPVSWLTQPGPWDIPAVADRVADHIESNWGRPVLVCGHSTGGAIALQLALRRPATVLGLVLVDTGAPGVGGRARSPRGLRRPREPARPRPDRRPAQHPAARRRVHGRHDRARPPQQGRELADSLPNAGFRLVGAGHTPVYETPDAVAACIRDVLSRTDHGRAVPPSCLSSARDLFLPHELSGHRFRRWRTD